MKIEYLVVALLFFIFFLVIGCTNEEYDRVVNQEFENNCAVRIYENSDFEGDNFLIDLSGPYSNLNSLPGSSGNWSDRISSLAVNEEARVVVYSSRNFLGDSTVYGSGKHVNTHPIQSLKLFCERK